jgi:hypothetical protein
MAALLCSGCGSPLTLPTDLLAQDTTCQFCPARTLLPSDLVQVRLLEHQEAAKQAQDAAALAEQAQVAATVGNVVKRTTSVMLVVILVSTILPIILAGGGIWLAMHAASHAAPHATHGH